MTLFFDGHKHNWKSSEIEIFGYMRIKKIMYWSNEYSVCHCKGMDSYR